MYWILLDMFFYIIFHATKVPNKSNFLSVINYNINDPIKNSIPKMFTDTKIKKVTRKHYTKPIFSSFPSENKEPMREEYHYLLLVQTLLTFLTPMFIVNNNICNNINSKILLFSQNISKLFVLDIIIIYRHFIKHYTVYVYTITNNSQIEQFKTSEGKQLIVIRK